MSEVSMPTFTISGISEGEADAVAGAINIVWKLDDWHVFDRVFTGMGVMDARRISLEDLRQWVQSAVTSVIHTPVTVEIYEFEDEDEELEEEEIDSYEEDDDEDEEDEDDLDEEEEEEEDDDYVW